MYLFAVSVVMKPAPGSDNSQQESSPVSILTVSTLVFALMYKGAKCCCYSSMCVSLFTALWYIQDVYLWQYLCV